MLYKLNHMFKKLDFNIHTIIIFSFAKKRPQFFLLWNLKILQNIQQLQKQINYFFQKYKLFMQNLNFYLIC